MDESVNERLNRLIDDDLDPQEAATLRASVESERALRRELEGLERVRISLHALADRDCPPERLDQLVDPLLRGRPDTTFAPRWVRWLAAAAVVVLGATVVLEVQRRPSDPGIRNWQERAMEGAAAAPTARFSLAPLPTGSIPADERPLGVADRLMSAPDPEIPTVPEPAPALEVMGPLDAEPEDVGRSGADTTTVSGAPAVRKRLDADTAAAEENAPTSERAAAPASVGVRSGKTSGDGEQRGTGASDLRMRSQGSNAAVVRAQLFVFMQANTAWRSFEHEGPCEPGRYAVRVRIEGGVVEDVWPVANPPATTGQARASQLVLGLAIDDVADGEYSGEVVVEPRRPDDR